MGRRGFLLSVVAIAGFAGALPARAEAPMSRAASMSEALGGSLDSGMIAADLPGHGKLDTTVALKSGRGAEYRRRVAMMASAQSHLPTSAH